MKLRQLFPFLVVIPQFALGTTVTGKLVDGGGTDDMQIVVQTESGQKVRAYCTTKCGDWFDEERGTEAHRLKNSFKGKSIVLDYSVESNRSRIAGPDDNERLPFVRKVQVLP